MTTELQEKAKWVSDLYAAVAMGETLQVWKVDEHQWADASPSGGPNMGSMERRWRIKPKPRTFWHREGREPVTTDPELAQEWRRNHWTVVESVEVLP